MAAWYCYCCCCCYCNAAHRRMICWDRIGFKERETESMYVLFVHCTMNATTQHIYFFEALSIDPILVARTHTQTAKEIPREHDRKNKMRLLANKNDIKIVSATTVSVLRCWKITMKWLVFHGKTISTKVKAIYNENSNTNSGNGSTSEDKKLGPTE